MQAVPPITKPVLKLNTWNFKPVPNLYRTNLELCKNGIRKKKRTSTRASVRTRRILSSVKSSGGSEVPPPETAPTAVSVLDFCVKTIPSYVSFVIPTFLNCRASTLRLTAGFPVSRDGKFGGGVRWWYGNATTSMATLRKSCLTGKGLVVFDKLKVTWRNDNRAFSLQSRSAIWAYWI